MKRFSPYTKYKINGEIRYTFIAPDGKKKDSKSWHSDRIKEIRSIFLQQNKDNQYKLKKYQRQIMTSILSGNDTFVILPTGSGKSLCFQAPSVFFPGITLVITPLVALIENQVDNFNRNSYPIYHPYAGNYYENICFKAIYPGMDGISIREMFSEIQNPRKIPGSMRKVHYKFLYVSPERLCNPKFLRALNDAESNGLSIDHVVIDEVHCMSQWGFEFRESYLHITNFISQRPVRPIISAFTATATPKDIAEIKNILHFPTDKKEYESKKYQEISHIEKRENLSLHVIQCSDYGRKEDDGNINPQASSLKTRLNTLTEILEKNMSKICIIYRSTAAGVDELYQTLSGYELFRDRLAKYHAQMSARAKAGNKNSFLASRSETLSTSISPSDPPGLSRNIMIATKAFGMGIDKSDISLIIHFDMPRSLEDYYQEVGRAGRDAEKIPVADCYLLYACAPKTEKGTLQYTMDWITSEKEPSGSGCMPISSQFSEEMKENIYFWSYYRLCYVRKYCNIMKANENSDAAHSFIIQYLKNNISLKQAARDLDNFYGYAAGYYQASLPESESFIETHLFRGSDAAKFLCSRFEQAQNRLGKYHDEIRRLTGDVNELHINNTYVANLLRHHPDEYQPNVPYILSEAAPSSGQEWKSKQNKKVNGLPSLTLRRTDISKNACFIFAADPKNLETYVNALWNSRRNRKSRADILFTVNHQCIVSGVFEMHEGQWTLMDEEESLLPYRRYIGCDIRGLFPKERYSQWRNTIDTSQHSCADKTAAPSGADELFAYIPGTRAHELIFTIHGGEKLSYFDMCVLDAVYSIEITQKETIYIQTIWEILTGRNPGYSSREKLEFRKNIRKSIDKMSAMAISVFDNQCSLEIKDEIFLPLKAKPKGQKGYTYSTIPPLFQYAEELNGQIIRVPVSLLNTARIENPFFRKNDFRAEFRCDGSQECFFDKEHVPPFDCHVRLLPRNIKYETKLKEFLTPKDYRILDNAGKNTASLRPSIDNTILCHYLIHRTSISKNRKRGNYILFSTIKKVLGSNEDSCFFHKKTATILNHFQKIGYLGHYYLYITDYSYRLANGNCITDNAYFHAEATDTIKYWRLRNRCYLLLSDFTLSWSLRHHEQLLNSNSNFEIKTELLNAVHGGAGLSSHAKRELAAVSIGRMDGIVLRHEK